MQRVDPKATPHVVIVGGGFGGLAAARALKNTLVRITLVDRRNFHLFQPLLYQVATGWLSPANVASNLRAALRYQKNARVLFLERSTQESYCSRSEKQNCSLAARRLQRSLLRTWSQP